MTSVQERAKAFPRSFFTHGETRMILSSLGISNKYEVLTVSRSDTVFVNKWNSVQNLQVALPIIQGDWQNNILSIIPKMTILTDEFTMTKKRFLIGDKSVAKIGDVSRLSFSSDIQAILMRYCPPDLDLLSTRLLTSCIKHACSYKGKTCPITFEVVGVRPVSIVNTMI